MKLNEVSMYDKTFMDFTFRIDKINLTKIIKQGLLYEYLSYLYEKREVFHQVKNTIEMVLTYMYNPDTDFIKYKSLFKDCISKLYKKYSNQDVDIIYNYFLDVFDTIINNSTYLSNSKDLMNVYEILPFNVFYDIVEDIYNHTVVKSEHLMELFIMRNNLFNGTISNKESEKIVELFFSKPHKYKYLTLDNSHSQTIPDYRDYLTILSSKSKNETLKNIVKSFALITSSKLTKDITSDLMLVLEKMERNNRIKRVLYNGEARVKGNIYPDTIQKYIDNLIVGGTKYTEPKTVVIPSKEVTLPDGSKIWTKEKTQLQGKTKLPLDPEIQSQIDTLQVLLEKSKQTNKISNTYKIKQKLDLTNRFDKTRDYIQKNKMFITISNSKYSGTNMQTLLRNDLTNHKLMMFYIRDLYAFLRYMNINQYDIDISDHQGNDTGDLPVGFIRYHYIDDKIFINTIQTDINSIIITADELENESDIGEDAMINSVESNNLYKFIIRKILQKFIKYMHNNAFTQIIIPTSDFRGEVMEQYGFQSAYDELPKIMGFEKIKFGDTIWEDKMDTYRYKDKNVWVLNGLNESFNQK